MNSKKDDDEWEMLGHDPAPGYKTAFYIAISLSLIYLIYAFTAGFGAGGIH